ncbi:MAG TPA: ASCH domain-containing protein [Cyclobacteriaceae bacterium]|nr:ASCH domain-containing protein [Cyclobacteriaceae bacterium]
MKITRAISIRQPFVEQILQGKKKFEYRTIPTKIRERVYIYASMKIREEDSLWKKAGKKKGDLPTGCIVGSVEIIDCEPHVTEGYQYKLKNPKRLRTLLKAKNQPAPVFWKPKF